MKSGSLKGRKFDIFNYIFAILIALATFFPFWDSFIVSITSLQEYLASSVHLYPKNITFEAYIYLYGMKELWRSYGVSIFITVVGTALSMFVTLMGAYALSKRDLKGQSVIMFLIVFSMLFSGGIIPTYIVVMKVGLMNTPWALMLPTLINTYYLIILRGFLNSMPPELEDSAKIDGCNDVGILFRIVIPLSLPAIVTISLFYAVGRWNDFFNAVLYISDKGKWPLQLFLRGMLFENESAAQGGVDSPYLLGTSIKMATIMVAIIPIMMVFPFFQKYFVKGVLTGAVKE